MFISSRVAIMNAGFQMLWEQQYKNLQALSVLPGGTYFYYYGLASGYAQTEMWWKEDVNTLFFCLNVLNNTHWVAMVISIPDRTVKIYDRWEPEDEDNKLRKEAEPFARMLPYALCFFTTPEQKSFVDRTEFTIELYEKGFHEQDHHMGTVGMGVEFSAKHLNNDKMTVVREKLAAKMYVETAREGKEMWNNEFVTNVIHAAVQVE
ncbi:hypothetical protein N665_1277s0005 [Sinapis alba]|nr:hypothetical protein N665_1277s0005 [Sinapis alba]